MGSIEKSMASLIDKHNFLTINEISKSIKSRFLKYSLKRALATNPDKYDNNAIKEVLCPVSLI